jgi:Ni/Co efflux regulator RcnB
MGKIVVLILGLALVAFVAKTALDQTAGSRAQTHSAPRRQLDQVRSKAHDLERQEQEAVDKAAAQADSQ